MKYLKLYETKLIPKYKVGDYIHLDMEPDFSYDDCLGKIVKIDKNGFLVEPDEKERDNTNLAFYINHFNPFPYSVKFYNKGYNIEERLIDRYLNKEEIEYFKYLLKNKDFRKFNI